MLDAGRASHPGQMPTKWLICSIHGWCIPKPRALGSTMFSPHSAHMHETIVVSRQHYDAMAELYGTDGGSCPIIVSSCSSSSFSSSSSLFLPLLLPLRLHLPVPLAVCIMFHITFVRSEQSYTLRHHNDRSRLKPESLTFTIVSQCQIQHNTTISCSSNQSGEFVVVVVVATFKSTNREEDMNCHLCVYVC
jgi:hypothetical protein